MPRLLADPGPVVVAKVMAYCAVEHLDAIPLHAFQHTALIRHPARTVPSLWKASHDPQRTGWDSFDEREVGFEALAAVVQTASAATGRPPVVIDADELLADPSGMLQAWCAAVGLSWTPEMLTWEPGPVPAWDMWPGWHDAALASSGLLQRDRTEPPPVPPHLQPIVDRALPAYRGLLEGRLRV